MVPTCEINSPRDVNIDSVVAFARHSVAIGITSIGIPIDVASDLYVASYGLVEHITYRISRGQVGR
jgi:hypothetical protein